MEIPKPDLCLSDETRKPAVRSAQYGDICVAVATPPGQSGIAVIRLSGAGAAELVDPLFIPASDRFLPVLRMPGYTCSVGDLVDPGDAGVLDQVVLTRYVSPHSYTGEDVIELSCHGGAAVKQGILDLLLQQGARPAEAGEFTKRAFLNGKIDLAQAEAVMDLISAGAARSARNAAAQLKGRLSDQVRQQTDSLYQLLARIELILEYPDHEESEAMQERLQTDLQEIAGQLRNRAASYEQGRLLREGLTVVLAGRPNAGKSSLLNALAGYDRAIVTPIPGTTRDTVEEIVDIKGVPVRLIDTAGLRETSDLIEKIGVDRTKKALQGADLVFWLISPPASELDQELELLQQVQCRKLIPLVSKDDLSVTGEVIEQLRGRWPDGRLMTCSVVTGEGLDQIRQAIVEAYEAIGELQDDDALITNSRHRHCLEQAARRIAEAESVITSGLTLDIVASLVRGSLEALAEITGDVVTDALLQTIFSRFCVGK
ncbi:MAG: tRNA uridine-5-carboxymethylaminomethyl(34) synthesis GTPase MnmE [Bacillota bacterium]|nr:tRNA uridine-5-carboxymethylaminomethyl(34) synthesis GTPase MnmE [Bacillota bacterium]